jgi:hypothetical protein
LLPSPDTNWSTAIRVSMESHSGAAMHPLETTRKGKHQQTSDRLVKYRILVNLQPAFGFELPFSETGHGLGFRVPPEKHFVPAIAGLDIADGSKGKRFFSMVAPGKAVADAGRPY